jgi:hypothetical protein
MRRAGGIHGTGLFHHGGGCVDYDWEALGKGIVTFLKGHASRTDACAAVPASFDWRQICRKIEPFTTSFRHQQTLARRQIKPGASVTSKC